MSNENTILVIYFSDEILDKMAEIFEVQVRLLDYNYNVEFKTYAVEMFE